jgi:hypothetical protein
VNTYTALAKARGQDYSRQVIASACGVTCSIVDTALNNKAVDNVKLARGLQRLTVKKLDAWKRKITDHRGRKKKAA